jgi:hypothetical protein
VPRCRLIIDVVDGLTADDSSLTVTLALRTQGAMPEPALEMMIVASFSNNNGWRLGSNTSRGRERTARPAAWW